MNLSAAQKAQLRRLGGLHRSLWSISQGLSRELMQQRGEHHSDAVARVNRTRNDFEIQGRHATVWPGDVHAHAALTECRDELSSAEAALQTLREQSAALERQQELARADVNQSSKLLEVLLRFADVPRGRLEEFVPGGLR